MIGYFVFTSLIFLPVLERHIRANELCELLEKVSSLLLPFFGGPLLAFLVTGTYLMVINENYLGLGHFFSNPWSSLIVIKHFLLVPFLALAVVSERAFQRQIGDDNPQALRRFRWSLSINMFLGLVILLLTSIAQAQ